MTLTPSPTRPADQTAGNPLTGATSPASAQAPAPALPRADASEPAELSVVVTRGYN